MRLGRDDKRLSIGLLYSANGSHRFKPIVVTRDREPLRLGSDVKGDEWVYIRRTRPGRITPEFMLGLNATKFAEDRNIVILVSSCRHLLTWGEGKRETDGPFILDHLTNTRIVQLHKAVPDMGNPVLQGIAAFFKSEFRTMWLDFQTQGLTRVPPAWMWYGRAPSAANTLQWTYDSMWGVATSHIELTFWRTGCVPDAWVSQLHAINSDMHVEIIEQLVASLLGLQWKLDGLDMPDSVLEAIEYVTWDDEVDMDMAEAVAVHDSRRVEGARNVGTVSWDERTRRRVLRMASDAYTRHANVNGVSARDVVTFKRLGNADLVDRLVRTPEKKPRRLLRTAFFNVYVGHQGIMLPLSQSLHEQRQ
ncbi:unnamed protein product [Closterium sp. Naga37s-1]|nr:unnamed protein product [Closterium sp. Naga37s-1]